MPIFGEIFPCFQLVQFIYYCSIVACFCSQMKGCIKVLKEQPPDTVEGLLNALRYVSINCWSALTNSSFFFPLSIFSCLRLFTLEDCFIKKILLSGMRSSPGIFLNNINFSQLHFTLIVNDN